MNYSYSDYTSCYGNNYNYGNNYYNPSYTSSRSSGNNDFIDMVGNAANAVTDEFSQTVDGIKSGVNQLAGAAILYYIVDSWANN